MKEIYDTNMELVQNLISSMESKKLSPLVLFGSITHENRKSLYHKSKRDGHKTFQEWAIKNKTKAVTLVIPNVLRSVLQTQFQIIRGYFLK